MSRMDLSEIRDAPPGVCAVADCRLPFDDPVHQKHTDGGCRCVLDDHRPDCCYVGWEPDDD